MHVLGVSSWNAIYRCINGDHVQLCSHSCRRFSRETKTTKMHTRICILLVYQQIMTTALLHPNCLVSFPKIPFPETKKLRTRGAFYVRKNTCRTSHCESSDARHYGWERGRHFGPIANGRSQVNRDFPCALEEEVHLKQQKTLRNYLATSSRFW